MAGITTQDKFREGSQVFISMVDREMNSSPEQPGAYCAGLRFLTACGGFGMTGGVGNELLAHRVSYPSTAVVETTVPATSTVGTGC